MTLTGDTFDFQQGNVVTSSAQMVDSGATVGDVLTVQTDKSIAAAPGGGSQTVNVATAHVTSAQLKNLLAAPVTLVATPGSGKVNLPLAWFTRYVFVTTDYSNWSDIHADPWITLGNLAQLELLDPSGSSQNTGNFSTGAQPPDPATFSGFTFETAYADTPILLQNFGNADLIGGDSTLSITTYYATLTLS